MTNAGHTGDVTDDFTDFVLSVIAPCVTNAGHTGDVTGDSTDFVLSVMAPCVTNAGHAADVADDYFALALNRKNQRLLRLLRKPS